MGNRTGRQAGMAWHGAGGEAEGVNSLIHRQQAERRTSTGN